MSRLLDMAGAVRAASSTASEDAASSISTGASRGTSSTTRGGGFEDNHQGERTSFSRTTPPLAVSSMIEESLGGRQEALLRLYDHQHHCTTITTHVFFLSLYSVDVENTRMQLENRKLDEA